MTSNARRPGLRSDQRPEGSDSDEKREDERDAPVRGSGPSVVALGGGHGLAATIAALRLYASEVTAVVSVADDGGSSGRLRRTIGIPAPGDLRRCLSALADPDNPWAAALEYRFPAGTGGLEDHALGNLMLAALAGPDRDLTGPARRVARLLGACGTALPATSVPVDLEADIGDQSVVGQLAVAQTPGGIRRLRLRPESPPAPPQAVAAIAAADQVVLGPGSLYTSVLAAATVPAIRAALVATSACRVYVCNLEPQLPETAGYSSFDHLEAILAHGVPVDVMVVHGTAGQPEVFRGARIVRADLAGPAGAAHEPAKLAVVLASLGAA
ncbi:MAG: gluconeogenesis factor YvcK family protein [Acidimicrobiales bacterium]